MVKEFKLKETGQKVKLEGHYYVIDVTNPDVIDAIMNLQKIDDKVKTLHVGNFNMAELLKELTDTADKILGKGSVTKIFNGKPVDFVNAVGLLKYLIEATFDDLTNKKAEYKIPTIKTK